MAMNVRRSWLIATALLVSLAWPEAHAAGSEAVLSLGLGKIFTFFFLTLGPTAVIAPFARYGSVLSVPDRRKAALLASGISLLAVVVAATIGVRVLENWGVSTGALLLAAGIMLFLVALDSIRSQYQTPDSAPTTPPVEMPLRQLAFRMAFPYVVSPYGVAVVVLVLSTRPADVSASPILAMLVGIMLLDLLVMLNAHRIVASPYLAPVMAVVASVLAVLQAPLGVQAVLAGLRMAGIIAAQA
jgi:small neutral amino acid transporter SnatA (MarC family)